jgi:catechol 2,3-dioxygenase-like lactoylglutathione lyase family enzyme
MSELTLPRISRRCVLESLGLLGVAPWLARADATHADGPLPLPLELRQIVNHIGISVPDVVRSATFYSHLFDGPRILGQVRPALRYSIGFYPGAMAIGALGTAGAAEPPGTPAPAGRRHGFIDHFCVAAAPFDLAAWRSRLDREGIRYFARGSFVDIGGISVQLLGGTDEMARARAKSAARGAKGPAGAPPAGGFGPMPPLYGGQPLVAAHGFEHVSLHVSDLEGSTALFRKLFGLAPHGATARRVSFSLGGIGLHLEAAAAGEKPRIASYAIRVSRFDRAKLSGALVGLGASVKAATESERRTVLSFADPDGIECEFGHPQSPRSTSSLASLPP